jgi:hypothetical protein
VSKQQAVSRMSHILSMWLAGTVRGCLYIMRIHHKQGQHDQDKQQQALRMSHVLSGWMEGTVRGCIFNMRFNYQEETSSKLHNASQSQCEALIDSVGDGHPGRRDQGRVGITRAAGILPRARARARAPPGCLPNPPCLLHRRFPSLLVLGIKILRLEA